MYPLDGYARMVGEGARYAAFREAIVSAARECRVFLDLGSGPGFLAITAARAGARRVYAVEPDASLSWARRAADHLQLGDRLRCVQGLSTELSLPESADCIVSDLRGCLPLFQNHIHSIIDARNRLLAPGGRLIGSRDEIWAAVVEVPEVYERLTAPWLMPEWTGAYESATSAVLNQYYKERFSAGSLLSDQERWAVLDYMQIDSPDVSAPLEFRITRNGTAHGIGLWFVAELAPGVTFSTAPGQPEEVYGRAFFPWSSPVSVTVGDQVSVGLSARFVNGDYIWIWRSNVAGRAEFDQNTMLGAAGSRKHLMTRASEAVPPLGERAAIDAWLLGLFDGHVRIADAAAKLMNAYPGRFRKMDEALARVAELVSRYT